MRNASLNKLATGKPRFQIFTVLFGVNETVYSSCVPLLCMTCRSRHVKRKCRVTTWTAFQADVSINTSIGTDAPAKERFPYSINVAHILIHISGRKNSPALKNHVRIYSTNRDCFLLLLCNFHIQQLRFSICYSPVPSSIIKNSLLCISFSSIKR